MTHIAAIGLAIDLLSSGLLLAEKAAVVSFLIQKGQIEGRSSFTPEEQAQVVFLDDAARAKLEAAIAKA